MKIIGMAAVSGVFLLNCLSLAEAQNPPSDGSEIFLRRMAYETELESRASGPVEGIERYKRFYENVDDAIESQPERLSEVIAAAESDAAISAAAENPEWLHGIDVVAFQGQSELPGNAVSGTFLSNLSKTTVWVVGWNGLILHSDDYGANWIRHELKTTENLQAVDFADDDLGVAVGHNGTILRTVDGGNSWSAYQTDASDLHRNVDCVDKLNCWVVGDYDRIYRTDDGGLSWKIIATGFGHDGLSAIKMHSAQDGLVGGRNGIWLTKDGGASWKRTYGKGSFFAGWDRAAITAIDTADGVHLWAVGRVRDEIAILMSKDSGDSWELQNKNIREKNYLSFEGAELVSVQRATSVSAISANDAYVGATNGVIIATIDGGENWWLQIASGSPTESVHAMDMIDGSVGWAVGNVGQILATDNGGLTWIPQRGFKHLTYLSAGEVLGLAP